MKNVLVVGGAGYIGSHATKALIKKGYNVKVFDSLENGHKESLPKGVELIIGNLLNKKDILSALDKIDIVMHFAAYIEAGDSMKEPTKFFENNLLGTVNLLEAMRERRIYKIIFSSTAAIFGEPIEEFITEERPKNPTNVYGLTKLLVEQTLDFYDRNFNFKYVAFRYFNAAGADESGDIGEDHSPETHLIPLVISAAEGKRKDIKIFGNDYKTKDGTCIRDYVHVNDIADAHLLGIDYLFNNNDSDCFNLGNGLGYSVREIINKVKELTGKEFEVVEQERREGDAAILCASLKKAKDVLGWEPKIKSLDDIITTALKWHRRHPNGFKYNGENL